MPDRDRDTQMDRVLRRALRPDEGAPSSGACLDPGTLARWIDNRLTRQERAEAERHASGCGRCQALLAAMGRTATGPAAAPAGPGTARGLLGRYPWLVPVAASGVAIAIWVAVRPADVPAPPLAPPRAVEGPAEPAVRPAPKAETFATARDASAPQRKADVPGMGARRSDAGALAEAPPPAAAERRQRASGASADEADSIGQSRLEQAPPPPAAREPAAPADARAPASPAVVAIPSADPAGQWRIAAGSSIQLSVDAGATWTTRHAASDVLTAGSSPSAAVCWVVGRSGVVLVTGDGATWERRTVPGNPDLVAVAAEDDRSAVVTAADDRVFSTDDGGRTWTPR